MRGRFLRCVRGDVRGGRARRSGCRRARAPAGAGCAGCRRRRCPSGRPTVQVPHSVQRQRSSLLSTASISPARMSRTMPPRAAVQLAPARAARGAGAALVADGALLLAGARTRPTTACGYVVGVSDRSHRAHLPRRRRRRRRRRSAPISSISCSTSLGGELVADGPGVEQADAPADAQAVDGAEVPELERQRRAALGQHLLGDASSAPARWCRRCGTGSGLPRSRRGTRRRRPGGPPPRCAGR